MPSEREHVSNRHRHTQSSAYLDRREEPQIDLSNVTSYQSETARDNSQMNTDSYLDH